MNRPRRVPALLAIACALVAGALPGSRAPALPDPAARGDLRLLAELIELAHERYGEEVSYGDLAYSAINGMLRGLDPHTSFLSPEAYSGMREKQQISFYGIGILVGMRASRVTVISPLEGGPAARLGVQAGDVIDAVDDEPTEDMTLDEAVMKIKGPNGTQVRITILRRGLDEPLAMTVTRAEIPQTTVRMSYMLDAETGYIQLAEFSHGTGREMTTAIAKLRAAGMTRLLFDLRNNGGGVLDQAIEVAGLFLPAGSMVAQTRGRTPESVGVYRAGGTGPPLDLPVVVLVNEGTASAAEIVAGALQDHDVALLAGQPSWGKGLVQTVYNLSYGAGLALTTAKYHTPSGRIIQRPYTDFFGYYTHRDPGVPADLARAEVFHTDLGRVVYGGGGITPDVAVEARELEPFASFLLARNAYLDFAVDYQRRHRVAAADWKPGPAVIDELRRWLVAEKQATAKEVDESLSGEDLRTYSLVQIQAEVLNIVFGQEARHRALAGDDEQIQAALGLFGPAADLLARHRAVATSAAPCGDCRSTAGDHRVASLASARRLAAAMAAPAAGAAPPVEYTLDRGLSLVAEVLGLVGQAYVDQPDTAALIAGALHGATDALDPFSIYLPPAAVAGDRDTRALGWAHSGLGLLEERGIAYVVAAEKGSPADQAGVQPGDIVAAMNGRSTRTMPAWEIRRLLAGPPGTRLDLELIRIGGELHKASLVLAPFQPPPPSLSTVDGAPVLRLATFDATTARAVERLLAGTAAVTSGGLVVDLRGTSAGDPAAAYATAGVFAAGDLGSLARRQQELRAFTGDKAPVWHGRLVVLVDRGTLGAAEVLATVLRQKAGAELVGERTFGYAARGGSVELATGGRLLYSEAFYSGPDRKPLNEALQADVKVDERSRTYLEKDVPITELILKRGVQRLLASVEAARKVA